MDAKALKHVIPLTLFVSLMVGNLPSTDPYTMALYGEKLAQAAEKETVKKDDGYVQKTVSTVKQEKINFADLNLPATVQLTDPEATDYTAKVYAYLQAMAASDKKLYGHQNDLHKKTGRGGSDSDTFDVVGDYPAVIGIDGLAFTGNELNLTSEEKKSGMTLVDKAAKIGMLASQRGALVTLSCHMPNFAQVAAKGKINGKYNYSGYTPNVTTGNVVTRILPGGDLNEVYNGYLDMVADFGQQMQNQGSSVLFRPFHENNGSWFWWGAAFCTSSEYKNLYRYTEEYLRDKKGIHNFLYLYSPNGPLASEEEYMSRYPGDAYVDIVGVDLYHKNPVQKDEWMTSFNSTMDVVQKFAAHHQKVAAVTETGILTNQGAVLKKGNQRLDWFNEILSAVSDHKMAYFMTWANFDETNFEQPYMVSDQRGHEMINTFTQFYNRPQSVFSSQTPDLSKIQLTKQAVRSTYGYITSPNSYERLCEPTVLRTNVFGSVQTVRFVFKNRQGESIGAVDAQNVQEHAWEASITQENLDALGKTLGSLELEIDGKVEDALTVLYNMPQEEVPINQVDNFESYYGDNSLLTAAYSVNAGAGCSIEPAVSSEASLHAEGNYGLALKYKLTKGGYAGVVKNLHSANWSNYNAIQFWLMPDGKAQQLIIQLNANGEDFEINLADVTKETTPRLVTIPFSQFKGKQHGVFNKANVQHFAIYYNAQGNEDINSVMYFDDVKAVE